LLLQLGIRFIIIVLVIALFSTVSVYGAKLAATVFADPELRRRFIIAGAIFLTLLLLFCAANFYVYHGFGYQGDIFRRASTTQKIVALTFDDGPDPEYTPRMLEILDRYNVPATFFMVGAHVDKYPDVALKVKQAGHELGNHTYDHINVPSTAAPILSAQIVKTTVAIVQATGEYPAYIRPPRGLYDARFRRLAELIGQQIVLWSLSSQDWLNQRSADWMVSHVLQRVRPGDILLFHDSGALLGKEGASREKTIQALPKVIEGLHNRGYVIVPLRELLVHARPEVLDEHEHE